MQDRRGKVPCTTRPRWARRARKRRSLTEPKPRFCKALVLCCFPPKYAASPQISCFPSSCLGALHWLPRRVWEEKCTNALRNGMCVLQEAKLAALASKRWEHQPREQCVQTEAPEAHGPGPFAEPLSWGPMTIQKEMALAVLSTGSPSPHCDLACGKMSLTDTVLSLM